MSAPFVNGLIDQLKKARAGLGRASGKRTEEQAIELPFLQLALEKIWAAAGGSEATCFAETLLDEQSVEHIINKHLDDILNSLDEIEQRICADIFDRLVTRSGAKFAMTAYDLDPFAYGDEDDVANVLQKLAENNARILKTVPTSESKTAFEIFHDVLGPPLLCWQERYRAEILDQDERKRLEREASKSRKHAKYYKRATLTVSMLLIVVVVAGYVATVAWLSANDLRQKAEISERQAQVSLLWNRLSGWGKEDLSPYEIKTLWELAGSSEPFRSEFINHLNRDTSTLMRLGRVANPIARAIGLRWPDGAIAAIKQRFNSKAIDPEGDQIPKGFRLIAFVRGLAALKDQLGVETYDKALETVKFELNRITQQEAVDKFALMFASTSVSALGEQLSLPILEGAKAQIMRGIKKRVADKNREPRELMAVAQSIMVIAREISPQELTQTLTYLSETRDPWRQQVITRSIIAAAAFTEQQKIPAIIGNLVKTLQNIKDEDSQELATRLPNLEAINALGQVWHPSDAGAIELINVLNKAFQEAPTPSSKALIAGAALPIYTRLSVEQATPSLLELIRFLLPVTDAATAERVIAALSPLHRDRGSISLTPDDLSVLTTTLEQTINPIVPSTTMPPLSRRAEINEAETDFVVQPSNLAGAQARLMALVIPAIAPEQAPLVFETVVKACKATNDPVVGEALAEITGALAGKLEPSMRASVLNFAKYRLANSGFMDEATTWAGVVAMLLDHEPDDKAYVEAIVNILKYPTTAGRPTEVLLKNFHDRLLTRFPDVPAPSKDPWHAVAWIEKNFPDMCALLRQPARFPKE